MKLGALPIAMVCPLLMKLGAVLISTAYLLFLPGLTMAQTTQENPSRSVGNTLGDVLTQRAALQSDYASADISELQEPALVGRWLERQSVAIIRDADGQFWLELRYQVVNVPAVVTEVSLPGITVASSDEVAAELLRIEPWAFTLSPVLPAIDSSVDPVGSTPGESIPEESTSEPSSPGPSTLPLLQSDRAPVPLDVAAKRQRLIVAAVALASVLLGWLGWWLWRNHHDHMHLPFNRAYRRLQYLAGPAEDAPLEAWKAMHLAFNQTAGRTVQPSAVPMLISRARWLAPKRERIEAFYRASVARFFQQPRQSEPFRLQELARDLARAERYADPDIKSGEPSGPHTR